MGKSNEVETKVEPWGKVSNELNDLANTAEGMFYSGGMAVDPYPNRRVADTHNLTKSGVWGLSNLSSNLPAGTMEALQSNLNMTDTYRDFDKIRAMVGDQTKAQLASTFAGGGINSGLAQDTYSRAMGEALAGVEYGAYENAKARQMQAIGLAPDLATTQQNLERNAAAGKLTGGGIYEGKEQDRINASMNRWNEGQMKNIDAISRYSSILSGLGGMGSTSTMPGQSGIAQAAGAGASGLGAYGTLLASGVGAPLAIGGGILAGLASL